MTPLALAALTAVIAGAPAAVNKNEPKNSYARNVAKFIPGFNSSSESKRDLVRSLAMAS